jgi:hypothetical protein
MSHPLLHRMGPSHLKEHGDVFEPTTKAHKIDVATYLGPGGGYYCKRCMHRVSSKPGSFGYRHESGTVRSMTD